MTDENKPADNVVPFKPSAETEASVEAAIQAALRVELKKIGRGGIDPDDLKPPRMILVQMRESLVHISAKKGGNCAAFRDNPFFIRSEKDMKSTLKGNWTEKPAETPNGKIKIVDTFDEWLRDRNRLQVYAVTFDPSEGEFCPDWSDEQVRALNLWRPIPHEPPPDFWEVWHSPFYEYGIQRFYDHIEYLFQVEEEREWFLDWLAHAIQCPGALPHHHFVHISIYQGTGRGWLTGLMARLLPGHVTLDFDLGEYLQRGFNEELSHSLIATVDEIREGLSSQARMFYQKLKRMTTRQMLQINEKYGMRRFEKNCVRWFIQSNHTDAIPIETGDRRFNVTMLDADPLPKAHYETLYKLIDPSNPMSDLFVAAVRESLLQRDLSKYEPGKHAMLNVAKQEVIAAMLSDEDHIARTLTESQPQGWPRDVISGGDLYEQLFGDGFPPESVQKANKARLRKIALDAGIRKYPHDVYDGGKRVNPWVLRNHEYWLTQPRDAILAELNRTTN